MVLDILASYYGYHVVDIPEGVIDYIAVRKVRRTSAFVNHPHTLTIILKWEYCNSILFTPLLALVKVSFLWTLIKLRSQNKWINNCLWATLILNSCFAIAAPLSYILTCNPIEKFWHVNIPGKCYNQGDWILFATTFILATDLFILIMPTWILHDLKMPIGRKMMVIAFLSFGVLVTIVGAVRTSVLIKAFLLGYVDKDYTYGVNFTLSNIESALAIIGCCGPTIKYILSFCFPGLRTADESSQRNYVYPPQSGSRRECRSRRYMKSAKSNEAFADLEKELRSKERDSPSSGPSGAHGFEMANMPTNGQARGRNNTNSDESIMITKTVAWQVEAAQQDSNSAYEQNIKKPHQIL